MLDTPQNFFIVIVALACSLFFMAAVNYYWPAEKRRAHNDLIGWQLSVLGTTYAVIVGFMLYTVWIDFGTADLNTDAEANSLVNVYRLADGLPAQQAGRLKVLARAYGDAVVDHEWGEMAVNTIPTESREITRQMWSTLTASKGSSPTEITAEDHALYELSAMAGYRRIRLVESAARLPTVLWCGHGCVHLHVRRFQRRFACHPGECVCLAHLAGLGGDCRYQPAFPGLSPCK
jgi:hypothetical protein